VAEVEAVVCEARRTLAILFLRGQRREEDAKNALAAQLTTAPHPTQTTAFGSPHHEDVFSRGSGLQAGRGRPAHEGMFGRREESRSGGFMRGVCVAPCGK